MPASAPGGSRGRVRRPPVLAILHGHAQVPDVTVDCNVRARRRRRRRLSGGATQTGWSGSRTGLICPSPARMAARQPSDPDGTLPNRRPTRPLHLGRLGRVRRYRSVQLSIIEAQPIIFDGGTTPGCLPTARGGARGRVIHTAPEALVRSSPPLHLLSLLHEYGGTDGHS